MITRRNRQNRKHERGSGLLIALCLASVFTICLASYIALAYTNLGISNRNLASAHANELAEAGMEQALWSLNNSTISTATGWTVSGANATLTTSGFNYSSNTTGEFDLTVANYATMAPTITSVGKVTLSDGSIISHTASSTGGPTPAFVNALGGVNGKVKFKSGGTVDSYNSTLGTYSASTATSSAVILSSSASTTNATVQLGTSTIKGYVVTQTGAHTPTTSSATIAAANILTSENPDIPVFGESTVTPPSTGTVINGTTTLGSPTATTPTVYWINGDLDIGNFTVTVNGPVVLNVTGNVTVSGTGSIVISATKNGLGAYVSSLELHVQGELALGGSGINNQTLSPLRLAIVDTQDSNLYYTQADTISTTTAFYGVLYFPYDSVTISSSLSIYGAVVGNSLSLSGSTPAIHYDLALRTPSTAITSAAFTALSSPTSIASWTQTN